MFRAKFNFHGMESDGLHEATTGWLGEGLAQEKVFSAESWLCLLIQQTRGQSQGLSGCRTHTADLEGTDGHSC